MSGESAAVGGARRLLAGGFTAHRSRDFRAICQHHSPGTSASSNTVLIVAIRLLCRTLASVVQPLYESQLRYRVVRKVVWVRLFRSDAHQAAVGMVLSA